MLKASSDTKASFIITVPREVINYMIFDIPHYYIIMRCHYFHVVLNYYLDNITFNINGVSDWAVAA